MADTIVRVVYQDVTYDLEIDNSVPLRLDVSAVEAGRIGSFFGVGSQTFNLPGTKANNRFFNHAYDIGNQNIPAFYNSIPGYIISDGETLVRGQFQLMEVITDEYGYVDYKCQISDDVVKFKDELASKYVKDADWSAYEHNVNSGSIIDSWNDSLFSGSIFYPLAEYGFDNPDNTTLPKFGFGPPGSTTGNYVNNPLTPIQPQMFLPAVKAKDVIDVLFDQVGYRATGSFIESEDFNKLYILPKGQDGLGIVAEPSATGTCRITKTVTQTVPFNSSNEVVTFQSVQSDPLGYYTTGDPSYYTAVDIGNYEFNSEFVLSNPCRVPFSGVTNLNVQAELMIGGVSGGVQSGTVLDSYEIDLTVSSPPFITINLGASYYSSTSTNEVWVRVTLTPNGGASATDTTIWGDGSTGIFSVTQAPVDYNNATVNMGLQFESQTRSLDIIQGLIEQFNLVLAPEYGVDNTIRVETFDQWMLQGRVVDWTQKYETAVRKGITHTVDETERELIYKHKDTADRFGKLTIENAPEDQYGTLRVLADNNISQGERTIGDYFGPMILASPFEYESYDQDNNFTYNLELSNRAVVPHLYKFENGNITSFQFTPRLGYKVDNTFAIGDGIYVGNLPQITGSYSTLANVSELPVVTGVTNDLNFNTSYGLFTAAGLNLQGGVSAYDRYWKTYIESLYWEDNRKVTLNVNFNPEEYKDIRLNDHIFIKDQQYRINKISGYNVTDDDTVKVELVRLYPAYFTPVQEPNCDFTVAGAYSSQSCNPDLTSYNVEECGTANAANFNYNGSLSAGQAINFGGTCYEVISTASFNAGYTQAYNVYTDCSTCQSTPSPSPSPVAPTPSLTDGWAFTAGTVTTAGVPFYGFHRGTLAGCPSLLGHGTGASPTTSQTALPGTDCYDTGFFLVQKGYGIDGIGSVSSLALTQFSTDSTAGTTFMAFVNTSGTGNPGNGTISGTIEGSDGSSGTWSCTYSTLSSYTDNNGSGTTVQPESGGSVTLNGLTLTNGVTYSIEVN